MLARNHIGNSVRKANVARRTRTSGSWRGRCVAMVRVPRICRVPDEQRAWSVGDATRRFTVCAMKRNVRKSTNTTRYGVRRTRWTNKRIRQTFYRNRNPATSVRIPPTVRRPCAQTVGISVSVSTRVRAQGSKDTARRVARHRIQKTRNPGIAAWYRTLLRRISTVRNVLCRSLGITTADTHQKSYCYQKMFHS